MMDKDLMLISGWGQEKGLGQRWHEHKVKFGNIYSILQGSFVADENGSNNPLRRYTEKTLVIVLPGDLTVFDIGMLNIKKEEYINQLDPRLQINLTPIVVWKPQK